MRPNPLHDVLAFLSASGWPTWVFWLLLAGSVIAAGAAWTSEPAQQSLRGLAIWLIRLCVGAMWWQQSLWKIPPNFDGLRYWMQQMVDHASIPVQSDLVRDIVIPNIAFFGPLVYAVEVAIGVSLMLGLLSRLGALLGALMALNLWLGLYSAPGEWPWTYAFLLILQLLFVIDPPGRCLGVDALLRRRLFSWLA
ncbi:MAG TPA: DoxX family membrane protein [Acetobacteraceae bacterium]|nr:DoxX family membrane protein [Acetobacteraceae bacterium]